MTLFEPEPNRRQRLAGTVWSAAWVFVTACAIYLSPSAHGHGTHQQLGLPPCPSVLMFDRPCPGCGLTTSWTALVHGDFATAFRAHALGPLMYLIFTATAWMCLIAAMRGQRVVSEAPVINRSLIVALVVFVSFGAARMATTDHYANPTERLISKTLR
ncbi:MAG: DUF2752 domain-containing protein [Fimbriimonas sp.]